MPSFFSSGGGGSSGTPVAGSVPFWHYLKPPASPHAQDDNFDDASIAAAWNTFDQGSRTTITETLANRLKMTQASGSDSVGGIVRNFDLAADEYNVSLGFRPFGNATNFLQIGLVCGGSDLISAPTTANFLFPACLLRNSDWFWEFNKYNAYNAYSNTDGTLDDGPFHVIRAHVKKSADRIGMLVSADGREFVQVNDSILSTAGLTGTNPVWFGPAINNIGNGLTAGAIFDFFQVEETTDRFSPIGGWVNLGTV